MKIKKKEALMRVTKTQESKRISIDVPVELHTALKTAAAANNMSIKMLVLRLVIEELADSGHLEVTN